MQSPFCRVALALPTTSPAPAQPVRVWLEAQVLPHRRSCGLKRAPGSTWVAFSPRAPPGFARDLALEPAWLVDRPARTAHPSVNSSGVNVRVARARLRSPGRCGSLSQAAPSRWLRCNLFKWQPPVFTDSALRYTHKRTHQPQSRLASVAGFNFAVRPLVIGRRSLGFVCFGSWSGPEAAGRAPGQVPSGGEPGARSPRAPPVLRQGTPLRDRRVGGAPSRRPRSVEPGLASLPGASAIHSAFLFALFQEDAGKQRPAAASVLANILSTYPGLRAEKLDQYHESTAGHSPCG